MREQFESLPEVINKLRWVYFFNGKYFDIEPNYRTSAIWMNGAWYAYQEQQKRINELEALLYGEQK